MADQGAFDRFIDRWRKNEGGAERANFPLFLTELCALLDLPQPDPADATHEHNDYVFERDVTTVDDDGKVDHRRIDLYRRGCFVLEAKQSRQKGGAKEVALAPELDLGLEAARGRRSAHRGWDVLMRNARTQAEEYARALPASHGWPPFILVCDVGHVIEVFADFSGQGKNYRQFPDRESFRIYLDDLKRPEAQARLRAIWHEPHSLDPARHAAAVTRDIARRLARVSQSLETRGHPAERVAHFLMRCLFTMFAEDVGLIDKASFADVLNDARANPDSFGPMVQDLWATMDKGGFSPVLRRNVRRFNGGLFADRTAIPLEKEEIGELYEAARHDWRDVEPAIFGTLLEQALDPAERKRLGAHYTPRPYVERLVLATVIEPLRAEWDGAVLGTVERERGADPQAAIRAVHDFHEKLAGTRVLDPACGTGNFLYVALELMKQLEGEVLEVLADLGGQEALQLETMSVHPKNFLGLELNPRAAAIAELVLWLGYLQWQLRNGGAISDPVLERLDNIKALDAVLAHDPERPKSDGSGTELPNPRRPEWPEADYIVGNPPFIGGKDIRARLGEAYATALWKAHPKINRSADFVMYWWDRAADQLARKGTRLKRFGFVTTNSITQEFSRRVIQARMDGRPPVSLIMAIPDHPWTKATRDTAAVRIAMTVATSGLTEGSLYQIMREAGLDTDAPDIVLASRTGMIGSGLTIGTDVTRTLPLLANDGICARGVSLHGAGFMVRSSEAEHLGLGRRAGLDRHIRPYRNGRDLTGRSRDLLVIDLLGLDADQVRQRFPEVYQHLLTTVKPERDGNNREVYRDNWWLFGEPRRELRPALERLSRYIATVETTKHRVFQFVDATVLPDNKLICVASAEAWHLAVLQSAMHEKWYLAKAGMLGVYDRPAVYVKSSTFDPFPFPDIGDRQRALIGALADELDATRKEVLAEHPDLTLTTLYNLREKLERGGTLTSAEQDQRMRGRVDIVRELHDRIDAAVAEAYGWPLDLSDEAIVARLVALNAERRAEEKAGKVRWLRPDYQIARAGIARLASGGREEQIEAVLPQAAARKPSFPRDPIGQTAAVLAALRAGGVLGPEDIARGYAQGRRIVPKVTATMQALARLGYVSAAAGGYRLRKAA
ncbi:class I SAM-dependent DNA methyltransferase [Sphingomonas sp. MAH-20]|uniref:site-specific DNA-methyltransferase (adenine-specific) n=1 Tax=Sphingomonas horti TaxID=2682842 RepID=A0A6I4J716_9SPHN|nr:MULTISPECIES: class I SAM-dependent DNA methyltransferase [Sphingomonas]MBA2918710.1 class I SAM-dependent DNA methyltransferase [Sphingomonas sp. CGMCC 1.13658]MVO78741.1 class I SAM-dependent DNA methyltransferase [Sphingomonas horti]